MLAPRPRKSHFSKYHSIMNCRIFPIICGNDEVLVFYCRFDRLLQRLADSTARGQAVVEYIHKIDVRLYARHAFPLPRLGKVTNNPVEQANSGLLGIREYAPMKLLVDLWFYI